MWPYCEKKKKNEGRRETLACSPGVVHHPLWIGFCWHTSVWSKCLSVIITAFYDHFALPALSQCQRVMSAFRESRREREKIDRFCVCVRENQTSSLWSMLKKHATKFGNLICSRSNPSNIMASTKPSCFYVDLLYLLYCLKDHLISADMMKSVLTWLNSM